MNEQIKADLMEAAQLCESRYISDWMYVTSPEATDVVEEVEGFTFGKADDGCQCHLLDTPLAASLMLLLVRESLE